MHSILFRVFAIGVFAVGAATMAHAQQSGTAGQRFDTGKYEYEAHCAVCHGLSGEGDGPYAGFLSKTIPNLTTLSKRNGGIFPVVRVYETIDGRQEIQAHGPRDMPIWGPYYSAQIGEGLYDDIRVNREAFLRARVLALTEYISRLQAK
jgi:mono/diheme cytochrome c family protein